MRFTLLAGIALLLSLSARAADFVAPPPHPIAGFADFEVFEGEVTSHRLKAGYRFYVDPARGALFAVMRYRVRPGGGEGSPTEKFVWNQQPGPRAPLRCFEWVEGRGGGAWREIRPGGVAYESEMVTLRLVLAEQNRDYRRQVHQAAGR